MMLMAKIMKIAETLNMVLSLVFLDNSVKLLLKQSLHNHTHLFIKAHTKPKVFFNTCPVFLNSYKQTSEE
jgi:hypothetical protein